MPGLPDHFNGVQLFGVFNNTLTAVAVDSDGNLYALLQGYDGAVYVPLRVDADGRIEAILKGEYAGVLDTVALDDQGRLLVVPTDPENIWGHAISIGNAELAARLGSHHIYDRRGELFWQTTFGTGLENYDITLSGAGAASSIELDGTTYSGYAAQFTAGSDQQRLASLRKDLSPVIASKIGVEVGVAVNSSVEEIAVWTELFVGDVKHIAAVALDVVAETLSIYNAAGGWTDTGATVGIETDLTIYHVIKLIVDFENETYLRLLFGTQEYDLSAYSYSKESINVHDQLYIVIDVTSRAGLNGIARVDHWLLTMNEPNN